MKKIFMFTNKKYKTHSSGFTLIELLVVISIIGILSSFAMISLNSARMKARDALRKADMSQMRTALNMYYDDNLSYPACGGVNWVDDESADFGAIVGDDAADEEGCYCYSVLEAALSAGPRPIMPDPPRDPMNEANSCTANPIYNYRYISSPLGDMYAIIYTLEEDTEKKYIRGW